MSKSRAGEGQDVRSQVIAAATRLFAARGFDGTSLQDIADVVGVTKPAVLHHFPSKEHIRTGVLESLLEHWREVLPRLLLAASAGEDRFDAIFGELQRFFGANPDLARVLVREGLDRPDATQRMLRGPVRPWLSAIAGYVQAGTERGRHPADLDAEAYVILALQMVTFTSAMGPVVSVAIEESDEGRRRYYREVARIAKAALFTSAPARGATETGPHRVPA
ncbi:MAG: TetR/AcrR family transcriptional regulator [Polyangiales bacterium]